MRSLIVCVRERERNSEKKNRYVCDHVMVEDRVYCVQSEGEGSRRTSYDNIIKGRARR